MIRVTSQVRAPESIKAEHISRRLRAIRRANGLTAAEMARLLEIERTYWTRWERGHRPIPNDMIWRITQLFEVDFDYVLAGRCAPCRRRCRRR